MRKSVSFLNESTKIIQKIEESGIALPNEASEEIERSILDNGFDIDEVYISEYSDLYPDDYVGEVEVKYSEGSNIDHDEIGSIIEETLGALGTDVNIIDSEIGTDSYGNHIIYYVKDVNMMEECDETLMEEGTRERVIDEIAELTKKLGREMNYEFYKDKPIRQLFAILNSYKKRVQKAIDAGEIKEDK